MLRLGLYSDKRRHHLNHRQKKKSSAFGLSAISSFILDRRLDGVCRLMKIVSHRLKGPNEWLASYMKGFFLPKASRVSRKNEGEKKEAFRHKKKNEKFPEITRHKHGKFKY